MFVDSHAHLDGKQFDSDREQVIARAREAGVQTMVAIGNGDGPSRWIAEFGWRRNTISSMRPSAFIRTKPGLRMKLLIRTWNAWRGIPR